VACQDAVINPWGDDLEQPGTRHDAASWSMAVTDDPPMPLVIHQVLVPFEEAVDFNIQGSLEHRLGSVTHHLIQRQQWQRSVWTFTW
jgi:hypothetical protein